ncbi:MAG: pyruvate dehydrogenase (acetyl-transferring) E1 component subunit alpha [Actinomycetia bacterium]|nr:pyruvate dehydrogenase (acetyl-transferring) E1 component subunit alpha [Actinomycetes bacterium]
MTQPLSDDDLRAMMTHMIGARVSSQRAFNLQRQGRAGTNAPIDGSEAIVVGAARALDPTADWVLPQYREPVALQRFGPEVLESYVRYILGDPDGGHIPEPVRVWPPQISLATQVPHAVGMAWGMKRTGETGCALVFLGDGSTSEGDFYEAANFAGVLRAPVIFVVVNNGWAISTPVASQTAAKNFAAKSHAFGFPGTTVDGTDILAVYEVVSEARERAVSGAGPTLIEAVTYRLAPHTTADDPTRYMPDDELVAARGRDPLTRFQKELSGRGLWSDDDTTRAEADADAVMEAAIQAAEADRANPIELFDHVHAIRTTRLERQRREWIDHYGEDPR